MTVMIAVMSQTKTPDLGATMYIDSNHPAIIETAKRPTADSETPLQLFFPAVPNHVIVFPTGMIPLFLVPYAIFFHVLSALNYSMHEKKGAGEYGPSQPVEDTVYRQS